MSSVVDSYPLSPLQEGMLFNALYSPHSGIDITQIVCRMHHALDVEVFRRAWIAMVERHANLRVSFRWEGLDKPLQDVQSSAELEYIVHDMKESTPGRVEGSVNDYLKADRRRGFDILRAPLIRVAVFIAADQESIFVWTVHHLVLDAHSFTLVLRDLFSLYEAMLAGKVAVLPEPRSYKLYIDWIRAQDAGAAESYWRNLLRDFASPISVSVFHDPARLSKARGSFGRREAELPPGLRPMLKSLGDRHGFTVHTCVAAVWAIMLSRYSGSADVVFGSVRGCRGIPIEGADSIVGLFINSLPARARIDDRVPLIAFLRELRSQHISTRVFEHASLTNIQRWSGIAPGLPLFESLLNYQVRSLSASLEAIGVSSLEREWEVLNQTNIPLSFDVYEEPRFRIVVDFDRALFDDAAVDALLGHFRMLLSEMAADPDRTIGNLPMLEDNEQRKILVEWNATEAEYRGGKTIHGLFEEQAVRTPEAPAVILGDWRYSYRDLSERSNRLARRLRALGVGVDTPVAICLDRTPDMVVAQLAAMKAGGAYVPIDAAYPRERLAFMLEDTAAPVILTQSSFLGFLPERRAQTICLDTEWADVAIESPAALSEVAGSDNLAYIIYTSGSTGKPKGVCCRHAGVLNLFADFEHRAPLAPGDRCSLWTSVSFDVSVYEIFSVLLSGATLYLTSDAIRYDPGVFFPWLAENRIVSAYVPPLMLNDLDEWIRVHPGALALRYLVVGVEPINRKLLASIMNDIPDLVITNIYGPTEATIFSTLYTVPGGEAIDRITPIGVPVQNYWIYILDSAMRPVPVGIVGEIYIGGEGLARGYLNRPELTAERFVPDPLSGRSGSRLYRTGDLARYLGDGSIEFVGRTDFQVKVRGFRVEPGEIETTLEQHASVKEAVVLARADRVGTKRLVAYVITKEDTKESASELRSFLKEKLPDYMVPSSFVFMDSYPLTPNGKLNRAALPEPEASRDESRAFVAPRNETEARLAHIWERVMDVRPIGVTDNFFDLGGYSLLAVRLMSEITRAFGASMPLATLFQAPTIAELAQRLTEGLVGFGGRALVALQPHGANPPIFFVHAYGGGVFFYRELADSLGQDQPFYGLQSVGLDGRRMPHRRVEDMAAFYVEEMRTIQRKGPYYIGGRCLGAYVALEMANQLHAQGEEVALLAVLDSYWMPQREIPRVRRAGHHVRKLLESGLREKISYLRRHIGWRFLKDGIWLTERLSPLWFRLQRAIPSSLMNFYINVYIPELNARAEKRYVPKIYPGLITFFQATAERERDPREFWGKLTSEGIEVVMVPATHRDILVDPNVQVLAEKLRMAMATCREKGVTCGR